MEKRNKNNIQRTEGTEVIRSQFLVAFQKGNSLKCCDILFALCDKVTICHGLLELIKSTPLRAHKIKLKQFEKKLEKVFSNGYSVAELQIIKYDYVKTGETIDGLFFRMLAGAASDNSSDLSECVRRIEIYHKDANTSKFLMVLSSAAWPEGNLMGAIYE